MEDLTARVQRTILPRETNKCPRRNCNHYKLMVIGTDEEIRYLDLCKSPKPQEFKKQTIYNNKEVTICTKDYSGV